LLNELCPTFVSGLRSLRFNGKIVGGTQEKSADGERQLSDILLFDILRVDQMSLLEFSFQFSHGEKKLVSKISRMIYYNIQFKLKCIARDFVRMCVWS